MFPRNSLTPRAAHPLPPLPRFFVCACARVDVARPRCEAAEITGSLLRPPAANPKEANAMSSGERTLAPDKQRTTEEGRNPPDGGEWRRNLYRGGGGRKGRGRRIRSCQSPRIATLIPIPLVQFSSLFRSIFFPSRVFSFDNGFGG